MAENWRLQLLAAPKRQAQGAAASQWRGVPYALPAQSPSVEHRADAGGRLPSRADVRPPRTDDAGGLYSSKYGHGGHRPTTLDMRNGDPKDSPAIDLSLMIPGDAIVTDRATIRMDRNNIPQVTLREGYENGRSAAAVGPVLVPNGPAIADVDMNMAEARGHDPFWFRQMVPNRAPWDYKQRGASGEYEAFGNFHYGATGSVVGPVGIPSGNLFQEAGRAQSRDHTAAPEFGSPGIRFLPFTGTKSYGDDPVDQYWIEQGIRYANSH